MNMHHLNVHTTYDNKFCMVLVEKKGLTWKGDQHHQDLWN